MNRVIIVNYFYMLLATSPYQEPYSYSAVAWNSLMGNTVERVILQPGSDLGLGKFLLGSAGITWPPSPLTQEGLCFFLLMTLMLQTEAHIAALIWKAFLSEWCLSFHRARQFVILQKQHGCFIFWDHPQLWLMDQQSSLAGERALKRTS